MARGITKGSDGTFIAGSVVPPLPNTELKERYPELTAGPQEAKYTLEPAFAAAGVLGSRLCIALQLVVYVRSGDVDT